MKLTLTEIKLTQAEHSYVLKYQTAVIHIVHEYQEIGWFVNIDGLDNPRFAEYLFGTDQIEMRMLAVTAEGVRLEGQCYVHPLMDASGVNLKGQGRLFGYELLER